MYLLFGDFNCHVSSPKGKTWWMLYNQLVVFFRPENSERWHPGLVLQQPLEALVADNNLTTKLLSKPFSSFSSLHIILLIWCRCLALLWHNDCAGDGKFSCWPHFSKTPVAEIQQLRVLVPIPGRPVTEFHEFHIERSWTTPILCSFASTILGAADGLSATHLPLNLPVVPMPRQFFVSRVRIHNTASPFASCFPFLHLHTASQRPLKIMKTVRPPELLIINHF